LGDFSQIGTHVYGFSKKNEAILIVLDYLKKKRIHVYGFFCQKQEPL